MILSQKVRTGFYVQTLAMFTALLLWLTPAYVTAQGGKAFTLEINGLIKDDDSEHSLEGSVVKLMSGGKAVQTVTTTGNGKFKFVLDPGKEYEIVASHPNYTSKIVAVNTKDIDLNSNTIDYYKFPISIGIFKEVEGLDVSVLNKPIGAIFYNQTMKDFDYTADKFLRPELEKMMKELEKKKREEAERKKREEEDAKNKAKNDAQAKLDADAAAKKKAAEDAKDKAKRDAKAAEDAAAEAKRKAAADEDATKKAAADAKKAAEDAAAEAKRKAAADEEAARKAAADAKKAAEEEAAKRAKESAAETEARKKAEAAAKKAAEDEAKRKAKEEADAAAASKMKADEEAKAKAAAEAEEDLKKREEAKKKAEEDAKARAEAKAIEMANRKAEAEAKRLAAEEAKKVYVKKIDYDTEEGPNYIITKTSVTLTNDEILVYKKILFNWGGVYFKKDLSDITKDSFITDLKNFVVKTN